MAKVVESAQSETAGATVIHVCGYLSVIEEIEKIIDHQLNP